MSRKKALKDLLESELSQPVKEDDDYPLLDNMSPEERKGLTKGDLFIMQLVSKAIRGDSKAQQEIMDRIYGKAPQHITQDVNVKSYTGFLEAIAQMEDPEVVDVEPVPMIEDTSEVSTEATSKDGVSDDGGLLEDFGL